MDFMPLTESEMRKLEHARAQLAEVGLPFYGAVAEELQVLFLREYLNREFVRKIRKAA